MKGYLWLQDDGTQKYNAATDVSANGILTKATIKGAIDTMPEVPGVMVQKPGHVGVYEGDGWVIEAKGFASGNVRTRLTDTAWTHWLAVPWISYAGFEDLLVGKPEAFPYDAQVTTKSSPLNLWNSPSKGRSYKQVAKGDTVTVLGHGDQIGWYRAEKDGTAGQADGQYLTRIKAPGNAEEGGAEAETPKRYTVEITEYCGVGLTAVQAMNLLDEHVSAGYSGEILLTDTKG